MDHPQVRLIGDYIVGPRIGSGSFAVVWRATHRQSGVEVAVKEIDKKLLSPKVSENLLKEISILSTINHPNIIRFFEAIKTNERIYLVLEYCDGGDLAEYIHRHGKVSEAVARHFMRQLALGLQILQEKHLIHRDLKPQNLLLSSDEAMPVLKIGDFGFARSLTPHDLADTLCGSPLYMAPEIIQNQKYDAKADLWSVGAILFQLVIGKPPFHGNSQYQLFQNILAATELRFPPGALEELHPDCVDLCRSLLRRNPVERITFEEFFNHKFLEESRETADLEWASSVPQTQPIFEQSNFSITEKRSLLQSTHLINSLSRDPDSASSLCDKEVFHAKDCGNPSSTKVVDSMESIEKGYVIVNPHFASIEGFSYHFEVSLQERSMARLSLCQSKKNDHIAEAVQTEELAGSSAGATESSQFNVSGSLESSCKSSVSNKVRQLSILHPSAKLQLLHHYVHALAELAAEKCNAGLLLESFSVQLVVLAIWKKTVQISGSWLTSSSDNELPGTSSAKESIQAGAILAPNSEDYIKFGSPSPICMWAKQGFIDAFERAEKLSCHILDKDAAIEMPDAMEIIYKKALSLGTNGAVEEYMENKASAAALYSKALLLLAFIVEEAPSLPLSPPFSLTPANKKRIQGYIDNLQSHQSQFQKLPPSPKPLPDFNTK